MEIVYRTDKAEYELDVRVNDQSATVLDLAAALGLDTNSTSQPGIFFEGRSISFAKQLSESQLLIGGILSAKATSDATNKRKSPYRLKVVGGLDAGTWAQLLIGENEIGRHESCQVVLSESSISRRHAIIEIVETGEIYLTNLTERSITNVDGETVDLNEKKKILPQQSIQLGNSYVEVVLEGESAIQRFELGNTVTARGTLPFNRPPRRVTQQQTTQLQIPLALVQQETPKLNLLPLIVGAAVPGAMAFLIPHHGFPPYVFMALASPLTTLGTWYQSKRSFSKRTKAAKMQYDERVEKLITDLASANRREVEDRRRRTPDLAELARRALNGESNLWERRPQHDDFLELSVGFGTAAWPLPIANLANVSEPPKVISDSLLANQLLRGVPISVNLAHGGVIGIHGDRENVLSVARGLVLQAAVLHGPADLAICVVADEGRIGQWDWAKWLPHVINVAGDIKLRRLLASTPEQIDSIVDLITVEKKGSESSLHDERRTLVIIDNELVSRARDSQSQKLRSALRGDVGHVIGLVIADTRDHLLAMCDTVVSVDATTVAVESLQIDGVKNETRPWGASSVATRMTARALAKFEDVELPEAGSGVPDDVGVIALLGIDDFDPSSVEKRWETYRETWRGQLDRASRGVVDPSKVDPDIRVQVGMSAEGPFEIDILRSRHAVVGGMTGSGKSELLSTIILGLALKVPPEQLNFGLFDFKGGASFDIFEALPQTVGTLSDRDTSQATRALRCLEAELRHRKELFARLSVSDIKQYQLQSYLHEKRGENLELMPYLLIIIDEFAAMSKVPGVFDALDVVASQGRSLGVHLILATQSPSGVVSETIRKNSDLWISLRVSEPSDSKTLIGIPDASSIARPGRTYIKVGTANPVLIQSGFTSGSTRGQTVKPIEVRLFRSSPTVSSAVIGDENDSLAPILEPEGGAPMTDAERIVAMTASSFNTSGSSRPRKPFLNALAPIMLRELIDDDRIRRGGDKDADSEVVFALADDPDGQDQYPIGWNLKLGNLAIFGSAGGGTTTSLLAVALSALSSLPPNRGRVIYGLDFGVGELAPLRDLQGFVGAIIGAADREQLIRFVRMISEELMRRKSLSVANVEPPDEWIILIDNFGAFRAEFDDVPGYELLEQFNRVLAEGPDAGIFVCLTCDRVGALPSQQLAVIQQRVVLQLADDNEFAQAGVPRDVSPQINVPGRGWLTDRRLLIQVGNFSNDISAAVQLLKANLGSRVGGARAVGVLSEQVDLAEVLKFGRRDRDDWYLPVGIGDLDLEPVQLCLLDGEHAFIGGPVRSGKSTTLETIASLTRELVPNAHIVGFARRSSVFTECQAISQICLDEVQMPMVCQELMSHSGPVLLLVDDAERLSDDVGNAITSLLALRRSDLHIVGAGRPEFLRSIFNHWTQIVRKSKVGILLKPSVDTDGDLLGVSLPRKGPSNMPAGRGYLVDNGAVQLVQIAMNNGKAQSGGQRNAW